VSSVRRAVFLSLAQRYVAFAIQFALAIVMARLLTPAETGVFSLAAAVVSIAHTLRDFGVGEYIIQERELSRDRLRAAFSVTIFVAWGLAFIIFAIAGPVAAWYHKPDIARVLYVLIPSFLLIPIGTSAFAMLTRELQFGAIFWIQTSSALVGAFVAIFLASHGHSYMSMAWSSLASVVTTIVFLGFLRPRETFMLPSVKGLARVGKFGGSLTIGRLAESLSSKTPDFVIGNSLGFAAVGLFSKANTLLNAFQDFFASGFARVATPVFATRKGKIAETCEGYLQATGLFALFPFAFYGFCALFAEPIIMLLFGPNWMAAVPVIQIASIGYLAMAPHSFAGSALTANGLVREILKIQLFSSIGYALAIFIGAQFSLVAVAIASAVATLPRLVLTQRALYRGFGLSFLKILQTSAPAIAIAFAGLAAATPALLLYHETAQSAFQSLCVGALSAAIVGMTALFASGHPLAAEIRKLNLAERCFGRRSS